MQNQIKRESPGLADVLSSPEYISSSKPAQYSPETDKNLEAVSQNANGVNYLDKTTNQILTAQQAMDKYGQPAQAGVNPTSPINKDYTATDIALFNKFLSGKDTKDDEKKLKKL